MADRSVEVLLTGGSYFEAPRWRDGRWWVSDFYRRHGLSVTPEGATEIVMEVPAAARPADPVGSAGPDPVAPDGCTLDAEGHIWVADATGGRAIRVAPGGDIVDQVVPPDPTGVFACMLGGDRGDTLLLCTAPDYFEHRRAPAREAVLLTTTVNVPHAGLP